MSLLWSMFGLEFFDRVASDGLFISTSHITDVIAACLRATT